MDTLNKLILGDNLEVLKHMPSESVDLIYLDPPFFSNRHYECIWGDKGEVRSFEDRWSGGIEHYIAWLKERVQEMHRILKPTGSIYLHCDHHADAYIRVYILDPIFGPNNFRNSIAWCYSGANNASKEFPKKHDTIFFYSKNSEIAVFNADKVLIPSRETAHYYKDADGREYTKKSGKIYYRRSVDGKIPEDYWVDINMLHHIAKERCGYPTQKPEALLQRIISASSNEGDVVLDPFVGGGTTIAVANKMGRNWIGIDQSATAIRVSAERLDKIEAIYANLTDLHINVNYS